MPDLFREYGTLYSKKQKMPNMFREYCYILCNIFKVRLVSCIIFFRSKPGGHNSHKLEFSPHPCPPAGSHPFLTPLKTTWVLVSPAG